MPKERLDKLVAEKLNISRANSKKIIDQGFVTKEGKTLKISLKMTEEEFEDILVSPKYKVYLEKELKKEKPSKEFLESVKIVYEDEYIYIVEKPAGLIVVDLNTKENTLVDILKYKKLILADVEPEREGIVHRLDKDTSGLLVIAKTNEAYKEFKALFKNRKIHKTYMAIVNGIMENPKAKIHMPIRRSLKDRTKMEVHKTGREAITIYTVEEEFVNKNESLLKVNIETGRTHQIRVHLAEIGHAIVGDDKYNRKKEKLVKRQMLHAMELNFEHPFTKENVQIKIDLPKDMLEYIKTIRKW